MNTNVKFFEDEIVNAVGAGVYGIYIRIGEEQEKLLYVGESVYAAVRCAGHLYKISKGIGYLGFNEDMLNKNNITLIFRLRHYNVDDKTERLKLEKEIIDSEKPIMQSGIKDRVKSVEDMIGKLKDLLRE